MRVALAVALLALAGCATTGGTIVIEPGAPPPQHVEIPPGHMPPPGKCRIWYSDRPPGQQPPPGECRELRYRVPPGAILIGR